MSATAPQPTALSVSLPILAVSPPSPASEQPSPARIIDRNLPSGLAPSIESVAGFRGSHERLRSVVDALMSLRKEEEKEQAQLDEKDEELDPRIVEEGVQAFKEFESRMQKLDEGIQNFTNQVQQLSASVVLRSSAYELRVRLTQLRHTFRENASAIFGAKAMPKEKPPHIPRNRQQPLKATQKLPSDPDKLPQELETLAEYLGTFLQQLDLFPEFDGAFKMVALHFCADLKYWASCLGEFEGQFRSLTVRLHVNNITDEIGDHVKSITLALLDFVNVGIPTIRQAQKQISEGLLNLSTVATFFSAVTATTLQYGYPDPDTTYLQSAVNLLWLVSLVFSVASAINSQLAYYWRSTIYRSPRARIPWWIAIWIIWTPLAFLIAAGIAFSAGLVCFSFARFPGFIAVVTTASTSISIFAVVAVVSWLFGEHHVFVHTDGNLWLEDILHDAISSTKQWLPEITVAGDMSKVKDFECHLQQTQAAHPPGLFIRSLTWMNRVVHKALVAVKRLYISASDFWRGRHRNNQSSELLGRSLRDFRGSLLPFRHNRMLPSPSEGPRSPVVESSTLPHTRIFINPIAIRPGIREFQRLVRKVIMRNQVVATRARLRALSSVSTISVPSPFQIASGVPVLTGPMGSILRRPSFMPPPSFLMGDPYRSRPESLQATDEPSPLARITPALTKLKTTQHLAVYKTPVKQLQFSPDGDYLATCSGGATATIWKMGHPFEVHHKLLHPRAYISQVAWSPNSKWLLTKTIGVIKVWDAETGVCKRTVKRKSWNIHSITWMPKRDAFISVEDSGVYIINLVGVVEAHFDLARLHLHAVTITPDEERLLAVGRLTQSTNGLNPTKSRKEKRIIVFNLKSKKIESQIPVLHDVRDMTLSFKGTVVLVSYEHKTPPQLFRIDVSTQGTRLVHQKTYVPPKPADLVGPSSLGRLTGTNDRNHLVICAGKAGEVHIWDHESARHLHTIPADEQGSDVTCLAWNPGSKSLMFALASHDGIVRIWTAHIPRPAQFSASATQTWLSPENNAQHLSSVESPKAAVLDLPV